MSVFTRQPGTQPAREYSRCVAGTPIHTTNKKLGYPLSINAHMTVRDTSETGLAPPTTSVCRNQNGVTQCAHVGSTYIRCYMFTTRRQRQTLS